MRYDVRVWGIIIDFSEFKDVRSVGFDKLFLNFDDFRYKTCKT